MNISGEITVAAPRAAVFDKLKDAPFFASCVEGVKDLKEIDATHYDAVLETKLYRLGKLEMDVRAGCYPLHRILGWLTGYPGESQMVGCQGR